MIDPVAATFERVAAEYDFGRPGWPSAAVESIGLPHSATVVDLGAGTGKLTRVLLGRFDRVIAVEPLDRMRALIPPDAEVLAGTAEAIPLPDESIDAVFCGEAFHWFDWPRAITELDRLLKTGGPLVMMWNRPPAGEVSSHNWPKAVGDILDRSSHSPGERRYQAFAWRDAFRGGPFEELRYEVFPHEEDVSRDALLARIGSWSQFTSMPPEERAGYLAEIGALLTDPTYHVRLETQVWTTRRRA